MTLPLPPLPAAHCTRPGRRGAHRAGHSSGARTQVTRSATPRQEIGPTATIQDDLWLGLQGSERWRAAARDSDRHHADGELAPADGGTRAALPAAETPRERKRADGTRPADTGWSAGRGGFRATLAGGVDNRAARLRRPWRAARQS
eukprot:1231786-Pleurochrysis_carterae.AAC.1